MFATLMLKTFALLAGSLLVAYLGNLFAAKSLSAALQNNDIAKARRGQWIALGAFIISFIALMFLQTIFPWNFVFMLVFTFAGGMTLAVYTVAYGDLATKALAITALTTLGTGIVAGLPGMDFSWMGKFLFIGILVLIIFSVIGLFVKMKSARRPMAIFGVILFTGYLLYDFNRLAKLQAMAEANNWNTALNFAISIYLDIINLFIQLMNLLSSSSN
ncbi:MAG: Bax inhibitor-1 family protein [Elusimicrobiota bacterium]|jgi:FtsH-binding integral membrane protein|nr:Bax inhibitor-1 family protein [Elusimicrobiota bacterium]